MFHLDTTIEDERLVTERVKGAAGVSYNTSRISPDGEVVVVARIAVETSEAQAQEDATRVHIACCDAMKVGLRYHHVPAAAWPVPDFVARDDAFFFLRAVQALASHVARSEWTKGFDGVDLRTSWPIGLPAQVEGALQRHPSADLISMVGAVAEWKFHEFCHFGTESSRRKALHAFSKAELERRAIAELGLKPAEARTSSKLSLVYRLAEHHAGPRPTCASPTYRALLAEVAA